MTKVFQACLLRLLRLLRLFLLSQRKRNELHLIKLNNLTTYQFLNSG